MHKIPVPQPLLCLALNLVLLSILPPFRSQFRTKVVDQILNHESRLSKDERFSGAFGLNANQGGFP